MPTTLTQTIESHLDQTSHLNDAAQRDTARFDAAFEQLLITWNDHQDLRYSSASLDQLLHSRNELDERRRQARAARSSLV